MIEFSVDGMERIADELVRQGIDRETAEDYACLIGDRPIIDDQGLTVVIRSNLEIARVRLDWDKLA